MGLMKDKLRNWISISFIKLVKKVEASHSQLTCHLILKITLISIKIIENSSVSIMQTQNLSSIVPQLNSTVMTQIELIQNW